jgi:ubiquinone/menaquinone biosynthesis C-methylase UbiE
MEPSEYELMFTMEEGHWWYQSLHQLIAEILEKEGAFTKPAIQCLDAGCGTGGMIRFLGMEKTMIGMDVSSRALKFCRKRAITKIFSGDSMALPIRDASCDVVLSINVLYHQRVSEATTALMEIKRVLRPGGLLLAVVPAYEMLRSEHDTLVHGKRRFRRSEFHAILEATGLAGIHCRYWLGSLFPFVAIARRFGIFNKGRDFGSGLSTLMNPVLSGMMHLERALFHWGGFPFGVSIVALARRKE